MPILINSCGDLVSLLYPLQVLQLIHIGFSIGLKITMRTIDDLFHTVIAAIPPSLPSGSWYLIAVRPNFSNSPTNPAYTPPPHINRLPH